MKKLTAHENLTLWQQFKSGDAHAFQLVYLKYYKVLIRYGNKISMDTEQVMDAVHDLFLNLWNRRTFLSDTDNLVRRVAESRNSFSFDDSPELTYEFEKDAFYYQHDSDEREATFQRLEKAVQDLSPRVWETLKMRYFDKMGNQEIAEKMGINYQSVNNNIHRGVETLRLKLDQVA